MSKQRFVKFGQFYITYGAELAYVLGIVPQPVRQDEEHVYPVVIRNGYYGYTNRFVLVSKHGEPAVGSYDQITQDEVRVRFFGKPTDEELLIYYDCNENKDKQPLFTLGIRATPDGHLATSDVGSHRAIDPGKEYPTQIPGITAHVLHVLDDDGQRFRYVGYTEDTAGQQCPCSWDKDGLAFPLENCPDMDRPDLVLDIECVPHQYGVIERTDLSRAKLHWCKNSGDYDITHRVILDKGNYLCSVACDKDKENIWVVEEVY